MRLTAEPTGNWTLLRVKANDGGAGSFSDDDDYAGTNTIPPLGEMVSLPGQLSYTDFKTTRLIVMVVAVDSSDAFVNRGSMTFSVDLIESPRTAGDEDTYAGSPIVVTDDTSLAGQTLNRRIPLSASKGRFGVRLHTFANIPGTAEELRVYYKVE